MRGLVIGCSDGIGLSLARRLLGAGWLVDGISRRAAPIDAATYRHYAVDVTSSSYADILRACCETGPPIDTCVWCVGVGEPFDVEAMHRDVRAFEVNLLAAVTTASVLVPAMIHWGRGHLVFLSSQADVLVSAIAPAYNASKAGLSLVRGRACARAAAQGDRSDQRSARLRRHEDG